MTTKAKSHEEMQRSVCVMCFRKQKHLKNMTLRISETFKQLVFSDFQNEEWAWLPTVICLGCYSELHKAMVDPRYVLKHTYYEELTPPSSHQRMVTRAQNYEDQKCHCSVCSIGRLNVSIIIF